MKIVLINNIYLPEGSGGAEQVVRESAQRLAKEGHAVTIIVPGKKRSMTKEENESTVIRFKARHLFFYSDASKYPWFYRLLWHSFDLINVATFFQIKQELKKIGPDKVICHNLKGIGYLVPAAIRALSIPFELYLHDVQLSIPSGVLLYGEEKRFIHNGVFQKIYEWFTRSLIGSPDSVISPSAWLLHYYQRKGFFKHSKTTVLTLPDELITNKKIADSIERFYQKIKQGKTVRCVYIGKLEAFKGVLWLATLWSKLPSKYSLSIYGSGSLADQLNTIAQKDKRIHCSGFIQHDNITRGLYEYDMLIIPSLCYENRPETIIDALRSSIPVIASNIGGIPEIVKKGKTGFLFEPGNEKALLNILATEIV